MFLNLERKGFDIKPPFDRWSFCLLLIVICSNTFFISVVFVADFIELAIEICCNVG